MKFENKQPDHAFIAMQWLKAHGVTSMCVSQKEGENKIVLVTDKGIIVAEIINTEEIK